VCIKKWDAAAAAFGVLFTNGFFKRDQRYERITFVLNARSFISSPPAAVF